MFSGSGTRRRQSLEVKLVPSRIHFTTCVDPTTSHDDRVMGEFCRKVVERGEYPRLQVAEKDGHYFTLNNTRLHLFRRLQELGHCRKVRVEKIPLREIPEGIRQMMILPLPVVKNKQKKGYQPLNQGHEPIKPPSDDESSDNITETDDDSDDTDSDSDISDEDVEDSLDETSETPSQEEDESLL